MRYLHTMIRVADLARSLDFFQSGLGLIEIRRAESEKGRYTLVYLAAPGDAEAARRDDAPLIELTYNWDAEVYTGGRNFGHLAFAVDDIYATCARLQRRRSDHQPPAARRPYGLYPHAGQYFDRIVAAGRSAGAGGTLGVDGEHRRLVGPFRGGEFARRGI